MWLQVIYKIVNRENGKFYVGRSSNVLYRWKQHRDMLERNDHHSSHFQNAWNKYDKNVWSFEIFKEIDTGDDDKDREIAVQIEQQFLDDLMSKNLLYNRSYSAKTGVLKGEDHRFHKMHPSEWMGDGFERAKQSLREKTGEKNAFYGRHHTEETKAILREKCANFGEKNGFFGKKHSEDTLEKQKAAKDKVSKPIIIDGVWYRSIRDAERKSGITREKIKHRLKNDEFENFTYA